MTKYADEVQRAEAATLIAKTIAQCGTTNEQAVRIELYRAWPKHISPAIWKDEVNRALNVLPPEPVRGPQQGGLFE